jgi:hypothetical protein
MMTEDQRRELANTLATTKDGRIIREIVRIGESFLCEQLKTGLAADMRAMTLAAVLAAVIAGLVGGTATIVAAGVNIGLLLLSIMAVCIALIVAIFDAVNAARPTGFDYAGNNPRRWANVVGEGENLIRAMAVQASFYAKGIEGNGHILRENQRYIRRSLGWMLAGVAGGAAVEFIVIMSLIGKHGWQVIF